MQKMNRGYCCMRALMALALVIALSAGMIYTIEPVASDNGVALAGESNNPPIAVAGPWPYSVNVDIGVTLDGSASSDPDEDSGDYIVSYEWDLDNDGAYDDAAGAVVTLSPSDLATLGLTDITVSHLISLRVTDSFGASSTATISLYAYAVIVDLYLDMDDSPGFQAADHVDVGLNEEFTLEVYVIAGDQPVGGLGAYLTFDPAKLQVRSITPDTTTHSIIFINSFDNTSGYVDYAAAPPPGVPGASGTFRLCAVTFKATGETGSTAISFNFGVPRNTGVGTLGGGGVLDEVFGGTVTVLVSVIPGDANGDGSVNAMDITKLERIIAGLDAQTAGADANQDGNINSIDITMIERIIAGLE